MAHGPGKYDDLCTHVRETVGAVGAMVIVIGGERGSGFSVQGPPELTAGLPVVLRGMADDIEKDIAKAIVFIAIYDRPDDFPSEVVARKQSVLPDGSIVADPVLFARGKTVDEVRQSIPDGAVPFDERGIGSPSLVEAWML